MEHEIVKRTVRHSISRTSPGGYFLSTTMTTSIIRQCKHCGLSEGYIEHMGRTECRHQSEGE